MHAITKPQKVTELDIYRKIFNIDFWGFQNYEEMQHYELFYQKLLQIEEK